MVLRCIAAGKRNKEIGEALFISERTVKFHISSLLHKLGASNRTEAVKIAVAQKLIHL
jgi:DNA-binding NarL/FixJ family response regulator